LLPRLKGNKRASLPPVEMRNLAPKSVRADHPPLLSPIGSLTNLLTANDSLEGLRSARKQSNAHQTIPLIL
jgi:hypothetical protein